MYIGEWELHIQNKTDDSIVLLDFRPSVCVRRDSLSHYTQRKRHFSGWVSENSKNSLFSRGSRGTELTTRFLRGSRLHSWNDKCCNGKLLSCIVNAAPDVQRWSASVMRSICYWPTIEISTNQSPSVKSIAAQRVTNFWSFHYNAHMSATLAAGCCFFYERTTTCAGCSTILL
jgi:hypothetical protein